MVLMLALALLVSLLFQRHEPERHGLQALKGEHLMVGAWLGDWPTDDKRVIDDFEDEMDVELDLVDVFIDYYTPFRNVSHTLEHIADHGALPMVSWEPHGFTTVDIAEGTKEFWLRGGQKTTMAAYLDEFAAGLCDVADQTGQPVLLRSLHEMNGHWYTWGTSWEAKDGSRPNSDANFKRAWKTIHDAVRSHCQDGVLFVWAVNHFSVGEGASFTGTFPGDEYVDFVGVDGYNWGSNAEWGWQSFDTIFHEPYCEVVGVSQRPVLIAEMSSTERGGDKAEWIRDAIGSFTDGGYSRVRGFVWFNDDKFEVEIAGRMDWPLDSSVGAKEAFKESVRGSVALQQQATGTAGLPDGKSVCD